MTPALYYIAAFLLVSVGIAHSYLGERYLLIRLFRRTDLPAILGSVEFSKNTLRFAWHLTTVTWFAVAAILILIAQPHVSIRSISLVIAAAFLLHAIVALFGSKGRHLSWIVFLAISVLVLVGQQSIR
jgi:hypothetical protein